MECTIAIALKPVRLITPVSQEKKNGFAGHLSFQDAGFSQLSRLWFAYRFTADSMRQGLPITSWEADTIRPTCAP